LASSIQVGYCTNVHPGTSLDAVLKNIQAHSVPVRQMLISSGGLDDGESLGLGLWLSESVAGELREPGNISRLRAKLEEGALLPFTLNGFPQGDFHQKVVKHAVYRPEWWRSERLEYTKSLVDILHSLLPSDVVGSISTLPIAWPTPLITEDQWRKAADNLLSLADYLETLEMKTGRQTVIAIEPEPGCELTDAASLRDFFERRLLTEHHSRERVLRYLTVCHDICHSAVMFEDQRQELASYRELGMRVGKVQVSSAVEVVWDGLSEEHRIDLLARLQGFAEDRYLHQTTISRDRNASHPDSFVGRSQFELHEDLPCLLEKFNNPSSLLPSGTWRIHFHVPIFHESIGEFRTTRSHIETCLEILSDKHFEDGFFTGHFEIETYAWSVLPSKLRRDSLAEEVAAEFSWLLPHIERSLRR
jgi:hypothetical protein